MLTALLSELIRAQFPEAGKDIVCGIPHQLRGVLGKPLAHDNLIAMPFVKITPEMKELTLAELNRNIREQLRENAGEEADIRTVNGMMQLDAYLDQMPLAVKQQTIQEIVAESRRPFTFSVSYTGQVSWGGMERYIRDVHFYVDENVISEKVECEVYTIGDCFSLTVMQHGKNDFLVSVLEKELNARGVPCHRTGERNGFSGNIDNGGMGYDSGCNHWNGQHFACAYSCVSAVPGPGQNRRTGGYHPGESTESEGTVWT